MKTQKSNNLFSISFTLILLFGSIILFGYTYQNYSIKDLKQGLQQAHLKWIIFAMIAHLINHSYRAYRWGFMLEKQHAHPTWVQTFTAEMSGFFVNALGLRLGEFVRCQRLQKMQNIPLQKSLATVIIERIVDLFFFCVICVFIVILFSAKVRQITSHILHNITISHSPRNLGIMICFLPLCFALFKKFETQITQFIKGILYNIKLAYKANTPFFWTVTLFIWIFYFLLEYISLYALDSTGTLAQTEGIFAGIILFVILNISHIIPVSNGVGIYHLLVISALTYYNVPRKDAQTYALITHGIQTFNAFFWGGLCFIYTYFATPKRHTTRSPSHHPSN
ncbi:MAG: lysylphosphatidylglycerol synthase transmembrane domain-containing protein [Bacteroidota bacterium]